MKINEWNYIQLDSGHWVAEYRDILQSPIYASKFWCKKFVSNYVKKIWPTLPYYKKEEIKPGSVDYSNFTYPRFK